LAAHRALVGLVPPAVADTLKPEAMEAIAALRGEQADLRMFTGDNRGSGGGARPAQPDHGRSRHGAELPHTIYIMYKMICRIWDLSTITAHVSLATSALPSTHTEKES
jgi:hypothetical protein